MIVFRIMHFTKCILVYVIHVYEKYIFFYYRANENEWLSVNKWINKENVPCKRKNFEDQLPVK